MRAWGGKAKGWTAMEINYLCSKIQLSTSTAQEVQAQEAPLPYLGDPDRMSEYAPRDLDIYTAVSQHGGLVASDCHQGDPGGLQMGVGGYKARMDKGDCGTCIYQGANIPPSYTYRYAAAVGCGWW